MEIATNRYAEAVVARPAGRIDHAGAPVLEAALAPLIAEVGAAQGALLLDLSDVNYISSVGLRVLMIAAQQMHERKAQLLVAGLQSVVAEIFAISRFDRILTVAPTLDDALARCSAQAQAAYRGATR